MLKIVPYKLGSQSAKALARLLGVKRIVPGGRYVPPTRTKVINWGSSSVHFSHPNMLNKAEAVRTATNKLAALTKMKAAGISVPDFTTDRSVVEGWLRDGYRAVARHKLSGHSGQGIQVVRPGEGAVPYAPLYTRYTKKDKEYRIHVFRGKVIDICEKRQRKGGSATESLIRTHANGWIFCRDGVNCPDSVQQMAIKAVAALGLDFGGLDVITRDEKAWVLEVNTAPGLEGTTLERYAKAIKEYWQGGTNAYSQRW